MGRRKLLAVAALVVALPLFAWPIAAPPPDPADSYRYTARTLPEDASPERMAGTVTSYENLSAAGQQVFDRTVSSDRAGYQSYVAPPGAEVPPFLQDAEADQFVERDDSLYAFDVYTHTRGPSAKSVLVRTFTLVASIVVGLTGAHSLVTEP